MSRLLALLTTVFLLAALAVPSAAQEVPTWEGIVKTEAQKRADSEFVDAVRIETGGNLDAGAQRAIMLGWQLVGQGDTEGAIRRFNQAWLLNPERGDIYWGFAIATGIRGDDLQDVETWFAQAEERIGAEYRLFSDWGRILEQRGVAERAIEMFNRSIALNPNYPEPHIGLIRAYTAVGDRPSAAKHMKILDELRK